MPPGVRSRNVFDPGSSKPFRLSRSRLENFLKCPRCFYLDRRLGVDQPEGYPFNLNIAVDLLLKKEFDRYRIQRRPHPLMRENGVEAIPFQHEKMDEWRENFKGILFHHRPTNFIIHGAVDDLWQGPAGELFVVDYKATSSEKEVTLEGEWRGSWKRQMEIYQWVLRQNGFTVSDTGYFVSANGRRDQEGFNAQLIFEMKLLPYRGDAGWVEGGILAAHRCLSEACLPPPAAGCLFCHYRDAAKRVELERIAAQPKGDVMDGIRGEDNP